MSEEPEESEAADPEDVPELEDYDPADENFRDKAL